MITRLFIQGFRGIGRPLEFEFARVTLLTGRNGLGKTTVFDAIDWCLFGSAWRLGDEAAIRNLYMPAASLKVSLTMKLEREFLIERDELGVRINGTPVSDKEVIYRFVRDAEVFGPYARDAEARVRKLVYLPQAEIRELVKPAAESERVAILHSLLGVPNAAVVEKSLRRVRERIEDRDNDFLARLEGVRTDISQTRSTARGIYERGGLQRAREIQLAKETLGSAASEVESMDGLLALANAGIDAALRRKTRLMELRAWLADTVQRRIGLEASLRASQQEITEHEAALRRQSAAIAEAVRKRATARATAIAARERLNTMVANVEGSRRVMARVRSLEEAEAAAATLAQELDDMQTDIRRKQDEMAGEGRALEGLQLEIARARERLDAWHADETRIRERAELERQAAGISADLERVRRQKAELDRRLQAAEGELVGLNEAKRRAEEQYHVLLSRMPAGERLSTLLSEVARLLTSGSSTECPLCGAVYASKDQLLQHVSETAERRTGETEALDLVLRETKGIEDRITRRESEREMARNEFSELGRREEEFAHALRRAGARLVELGAMADVAIHTREGEEIQSVLSAQQRAIEDRGRRLTAQRVEIGKQELRVEQLRSEMAIRQARALDIQGELEGRDARQLPAAALDRVREAEIEQAAAAATVQSAEEDERAASAEVAQAEGGRSRSEHELADARGREAGDAEGVRGLTAEMAIRLREVGIDPVENAEESVREVLQDLETQERKLRRIAAAMDSLLGLQEQEERRARLTALERQEGEIMGQLDELVRAKLRFDMIAAAVRERAGAEAREALSHQTGAIQECLAALLPHRHLNRIVWDQATGSILVTDRLLASAVRPDLYTSTGQMNVLALAVFVGVALLQRVTRWSFLALDEPIQNLDDVHFLAFVTLMKRIAASKQVILSTADRNVAELVRRQLKSSWEAHEYVQYEWRGFEAGSGPDVVKIESRMFSGREATSRAG